jgi:hypothetical protein
MSDLPAKLKPAASQRVHLLLAAATWTVVGLILLAVGASWCLGPEPALHPVLLVAAVAVGLAKAAFVLRPAAGRVVKRIHARGDDKCLGGFFSWRTWLLVAIMIIAGGLLRSSGVSPDLIGLVYVAVGVSLLAASWLPWRAWYRDSAQAAAGNGAPPF